MGIHIVGTVDRLILIATASRRSQENLAASGIDPDTGGGETFSVPLSPLGTLPATHYGANTRATSPMVTSYVGRANSPFIRVYRESEGWTWETALADAGLKVIHE